MRTHIVAVLTCSVLYADAAILCAGAALAQVPAPNPTQSSAAVPGEQIPIFRVTVVGRETRETARGLIVNLSDVLFDTARADLKPGAREKLARVSGILVSHPGLRVDRHPHGGSAARSDLGPGLHPRRSARC